MKSLNFWCGRKLISKSRLPRKTRSLVVNQLIEELQGAEILHVDETQWYEAGHFFVAMDSNHIQYSCVSYWHLREGRFSQAGNGLFVGWLITYGYV